jgi:hypothetical protein
MVISMDGEWEDAICRFHLAAYLGEFVPAWMSFECLPIGVKAPRSLVGTRRYDHRSLPFANDAATGDISHLLGTIPVKVGT